MITLANSVITVWLRNSTSTNYDKGPSMTVNDTLSSADISSDGQKIAAAGTANAVYIFRLNPTTKQYEYS